MRSFLVQTAELIVIVPVDCKYQSTAIRKKLSLGTVGITANMLSFAVFQHRNNRMKYSKEKKVTTERK